ncbi:MAG: hypothetical protein LBK99_05150 [Opitutaceae bacterium]|jgi:hypothetical protein|nr:hypothetical protein [Opitutaceae bacterium]
MTGNTAKTCISVIAAAGAFALDHVATALSILAALVAIAAGLPVAIARWQQLIDARRRYRHRRKRR